MNRVKTANAPPRNRLLKRSVKKSPMVTSRTRRKKAVVNQ